MHHFVANSGYMVSCFHVFLATVISPIFMAGTSILDSGSDVPVRGKYISHP